jgi:hypothetical protein
MAGREDAGFPEVHPASHPVTGIIQKSESIHKKS